MKHQTIWQEVLASAITHPGALAVIADDKRLTYHELLQEVYFYANYLQAQGIKSGDPVAILLPRDTRLIVGLLAVLALGAHYVPLDKRYPKDRVQAVLEDSDCRYIVTDRFDMLASDSIKCLNMPDGRRNEQGLIGVSQDASRLAYIMYTSGSTGKPKGVMITHANVSAFIHWAKTLYTHEEMTNVLAGTSICFDLSVFEIFVTLARGCCVVLVEHILTLIDRQPDCAITLINTVPSAIEALLNAHAIQDSVCTINLAGEALQQFLVNALYKKTKVSCVYNLYGPTETTTYSSCFLVKEDLERTMAPIGAAIHGTRIFLLDKYQHPVPSLMRGEIYIAGSGLAKGYKNLPVETSERFVSLNIFGEKIDAYRTGDLARINHEGVLEYLGRLDQQVKISGFRIEPDEIIFCMKQNLAVAQAYVMTHPEVGGGQQLIAYVTPKNGATIQAESLKSELNKVLPDYMIPHYIVCLAAMPINNNGKIDRSQLPLPEQENNKHYEYHSDIEAQLAKIWSTLLNKHLFDRQDHFFYVGGHSLLAAKLQAHIQEVFSIAIKLEDIFTHPSIAEQAGLIYEKQQAVSTLEKQFTMLARPKEIPVSFGQQRLWYQQYAEEKIPISNIPITIALKKGEIDLTAFDQSIRMIISRHEILRTTYHSVHFHLTQVIHERQDFTTQVVACTAEELPDLLLSEANKKFDLSQDLMIRAVLFQVSNGERILMVTQHHIASDAWSLNRFMYELSAYYKAYHRNLPLPTLKVPVQYADYSCWQRYHLTEKALKGDLEYWRQQLQNTPDQIRLPYDMPKTDIQTYNGAFFEWKLPHHLVAELQKLSDQYQVTLFMVLFSAFGILLYHYTRQTDFCVGVLSANRPFTELEDTLGFFVNTLVMRNQFDAKITVKQLLQRTKQTVLAGLEHQQLPFDKLVEALQPNRVHQRHPLFQVLFSLQNVLDNELDLDELTIDVNSYDRKIAKFDLTLSFFKKQDSLAAIFEFNSDLFYCDTIARMASHYLRILDSMIAQHDLPIGEIDMLDKSEHTRWLKTFNPEPVTRFASNTLVDLFSESVRLYPEKIALHVAEEHLTYAELDKRSTQLAHYLMAHGIGVGSSVGLLLPRGADIIISMLAVLKTGGYYVPMDPKWPTNRLDYIIQDASIQVLLTVSASMVNMPSLYQIEAMILDELSSELAKQSTILPNITLLPEHSCYLMYTSGSTGKPKGVIALHRGVVRLVKDVNYVQLDQYQTFLQLSQLAFDGSTFEIWGSLLNGGTLVLMPDGLPVLSELVALITNYHVTTLFVTTQLFNSLVDYKLSALGPLRQVLFGGDVASSHHVHLFKNAYPSCALSNIYGPTECTTFALSYKIPSDFNQTLLPIGQPISNTSAVILSENMQLVPVNVPGEIYLGGPGLANGYLNQPELTSEKFIKNPFSDIASTHLYRTGDLGCYQKDGHILFLGRIDEQVKLRGYRIELNEIEQTIRDLENIVDAVVVVQKPEDLLVAYVISKTDTVINVQDIRQQLSARLPGYMLPDGIQMLDEYPLTVNGKINKAMLPKYQFSRQMQPVDGISNQDLGDVIRNIWVAVLQDEEVGYEDNFFEIGGNSLKIVHILDKLQAHFAEDPAFQVKLDITTLFQYPTIVSLTNHLMSEKSTIVDNVIEKSIKRTRDKRKGMVGA